MFLAEDNFVVVNHYKNLQHMIDKRRLEKEAKELLVKSVDSKKKIVTPETLISDKSKK